MIMKDKGFKSKISSRRFGVNKKVPNLSVSGLEFVFSVSSRDRFIGRARRGGGLSGGGNPEGDLHGRDYITLPVWWKGGFPVYLSVTGNFY